MWTILAVLIGFLLVACEQTRCTPTLWHDGREVRMHEFEDGHVVYYQPSLNEDGEEDWSMVARELYPADDGCGWVYVVPDYVQEDY